ncbi:MAG: amino acid ABC transporter substrate-binding protein [Armatimonadota bacterium]|nr:amino acid ABC transporter substrate-binding protein [Armatimonadota bacterium]MDR7448750.1 amino acid ABC transporter substrate-binding protein [Armatimonadota bacterium]MDR7479088.1 amino acid ABC transporter substrate-binding protein [Armatimonadota bacterium]MDR7489754.1 amino acid ABC transporter substrate-binding protein [Armatimonadota bacterium]MDR7491114.1 amino acid ABC transporter substrate-binding protein [Armatimonadota bacterium]
MTRVVVLLLVAVVTLGLWPAGGAAAPAGAVRLGAVIPLTGRFASGGAQVRAGYEIAVEDINRRGGVRVGQQRLPLELVILDDESDPTKTVSRLEALAGQGVVVYLGGFGSDLHAAAAAVAEKNRIPYCGVAFALYSIHQQGFKFLFSPFFKSPDAAVGIYRFLNATVPADQRPRRVAIFAERTDWGRELARLWTARSAEHGYTIVLSAEYAVGSRDFSDIILRAKAAQADAVFSVPTPPDGIALVRQMKELDFNPKVLLMIRAPDAVSWTQALGKDGDYVLLAPGWHHDFKFPGVAELNARHQQRFGRPADVITGPAYACVQIVADAVQRAGRLDPVAIRDAMAATDLQTVAGRVRFRPDGTGIVPFVLVQWQNGRQELVWPKELGAKPFLYPARPWRER